MDSPPPHACRALLLERGVDPDPIAAAAAHCSIALTTSKRAVAPTDRNASRQDHAMHVLREALRAEGSRVADIVAYMDRSRRRISGRALDTFLGHNLDCGEHCYRVASNGASAPERYSLVHTRACAGDEDDGRSGEEALMDVDLSESYRANLRYLSKCYFDCFARGPILSVNMGGGRVRRTTLCQLIFFQWARRHCVVEYIEAELARRRSRQDASLAAAPLVAQIKSTRVRAAERKVQRPPFRLSTTPPPPQPLAMLTPTRTRPT